MEHSKYIPLTDEQRQVANSEKGADAQIVKYLVLVPGSEKWELSGTVAFDAECVLPLTPNVADQPRLADRDEKVKP